MNENQTAITVFKLGLILILSSLVLPIYSIPFYGGIGLFEISDGLEVVFVIVAALLTFIAHKKATEGEDVKKYGVPAAIIAGLLAYSFAARKDDVNNYFRYLTGINLVTLSLGFFAIVAGAFLVMIASFSVEEIGKIGKKQGYAGAKQNAPIKQGFVPQSNSKGTSSPSYVESTQNMDKTNKYCGNCGHQVGGYKFCEECGTRVIT